MTDATCALAALAVMAGALVGERAGAGPGWIALLLAALSALAAHCVRGRGRRVAAGLVAVGMLGCASMQRALHGLQGRVAELAAEGGEAVVAVTLTEDPQSFGLATSWGLVGAMARLQQGVPGGHGKVVQVKASGATAGRLRLLTAGEVAVLHGRLSPLEGRDRRLRWRHAAAAFVADDLIAVTPARSPLLRAANWLRAGVLTGTRRLAGPERALVAGLLVGDDRGLPPQLRDDFRAAGLSHLLVVSGANVALALAVAAPLLRRLGLTGRLVGGLAVIVVFAAMTRFEPSVLRASVMAGLALLAVFAGRPAGGRRALALAVIILVLADPFLVHSLGYLMSCGASAGIVLLAPALAARLPGPYWLRQPLAVTAAAQAGVAPVALPAFGSLPLISLPANLLAAPAAALLTLWGLGSAVIGAALDALVPGLAGPLAQPASVLARYLAAVAIVAARAPLPAGPAVTVALATAGAAVWALRSRPAWAEARDRGPGRGTSAPARGS